MCLKNDRMRGKKVVLVKHICLSELSANLHKWPFDYPTVSAALVCGKKRRTTVEYTPHILPPSQRAWMLPSSFNLIVRGNLKG